MVKTNAFRNWLRATCAPVALSVLLLAAPGTQAVMAETLREALAARHAQARRADPERILITTGAQQGIDLVLRTFTEPGDAVAVAVPTYPQLFGSLAAHGLDLVPVEAKDGVADMRSLRAALARKDVRLLYVMPTFHNPTGATLDLAQRRALLDVVSATDVPVIEDEYECELRFEGDELPALSSLGPRGLTVTVRSFSKAMFPGVRLGPSTACTGPGSRTGARRPSTW